MNEPLARWHEEHANFARLLDLLDAQLDSFHAGDSPDYPLMLDVMYYMTHYPDLFHHPVEDLAFERIAARDPSVSTTLQRLQEQHEELRAEGESLVAMLDDVVNGAIRSRETVERLARSYITCFREHMQVEDTAVFPTASKVLSAKDWAEITAPFTGGDDPLFGPAIAQRYAALAEQIRRESAAPAR